MYLLYYDLCRDLIKKELHRRDFPRHTEKQKI
jgi:hypothetical protein